MVQAAITTISPENPGLSLQKPPPQCKSQNQKLKDICASLMTNKKQGGLSIWDNMRWQPRRKTSLKPMHDGLVNIDTWGFFGVVEAPSVLSHGLTTALIFFIPNEFSEIWQTSCWPFTIVASQSLNRGSGCSRERNRFTTSCNLQVWHHVHIITHMYSMYSDLCNSEHNIWALRLIRWGCWGSDMVCHEAMVCPWWCPTNLPWPMGRWDHHNFAIPRL